MLKCTGIIGIGMSRFVLYREVFFIQSVFWRFHCIIHPPTSVQGVAGVYPVSSPDHIHIIGMGVLTFLTLSWLC